ncbi:glucosidase II beta subunit-like protein-domain-containing protein [Zychaea mexicana]|uniref:glucosidase II beta subunit-like protein-domain-containing protein n=1 Tax=Zychaea mexicana TaxID=64656 RepID=UPI0022FEAD8A|nr:glucosidase II beta subunit-like protein-domain-containing protein [Zychaea mexicana]KAI9479588.1 glucosidase II beta subunit-like protein-domain-containing protein [Zychaea mexicana]
MPTLKKKNNLMSTDDALSTHFTYNSQPQKSNQVIMMSAYGQPFHCTIPDVEEQQDDSTFSTTKDNTEEDTHKIIERGLKLLEPLSKGCLLYQKPGYWTYEYCHKKHIRQFHVDRSAIQTDPPARTPHGQSFYLGFFSPSSSSSSGSSNSEQTDVAEPSTNLQHIGDQRYLTQRWTGGSECDLTGKPRTIEVQFHCDMNSHDRISMFQEVTTCQYQMVISTPRLCQEMMLASQTQSDVNKIQCNPIVPDHMLTSSSPAHRLEEQPVAEDAAPAEPELGPEASSSDQEGEEGYGRVQQQEIIDQQHQKQQQQETTKEDLLALISDLTAQINDLQRQVGGTLPLEQLLGSNGQQQQQHGGAGQEEMEVAFFHVDENGALVPEEGVDMKKLMESYMKMLGTVKEKQKQPKHTEAEEDQAQQRNRKAYEMTYYQ